MGTGGEARSPSNRPGRAGRLGRGRLPEPGPAEAGADRAGTLENAQGVAENPEASRGRSQLGTPEFQGVRRRGGRVGRSSLSWSASPHGARKTGRGARDHRAGSASCWTSTRITMPRERRPRLHSNEPLHQLQNQVPLVTCLSQANQLWATWQGSVTQSGLAAHLQTEARAVTPVSVCPQGRTHAHPHV